MKKILAKIQEMMGNWFNSPNPLFEFDIYKQGNKLLLFISFLRFGKVLTLCHPEEKIDIHSGVLREWEDELCPYDFPTKEEKEATQSLAKIEKEPDSYEGIYLSKVTGRIFEASLSENDDYYNINYCDDLGENFSITRMAFHLQVEYMDIYDIIFSYLEVERGIE